MADRHTDPDAKHDSHGEVEEARAWAEIRGHGVQWNVNGETWDLNVFAGRWSLVAPERLVSVTPSLTMDAFDAYKESCEAAIAFAADLEPVVDWRAEGAAISDSDDRFAGLNSRGQDRFGRDGWTHDAFGREIE